MANPRPDKVTENRIRRMAGRQKLKLERSKVRDQHAVGYATYRLRTEDGRLVAGRETEDRDYDYGLSLPDVEKTLTGGRP